MTSSEHLTELAGALAKAQAEFPPITRNRTVKVQTKTGGSYEFTYATLDHILELVVPVLSKHGLSLTGGPSDSHYEGRLLHSSGQWVSASLPLPPDLGPQDIGSALTYFRRYIVCTLTGIAADEDDDGNRAAGNTAEGRERAPKKAGAKPKAAPAVLPPATVWEQDAITALRAASTLEGLQTAWTSFRVHTDEMVRVKDSRKYELQALGPRIAADTASALEGK